MFKSIMQTRLIKFTLFTLLILSTFEANAFFSPEVSQAMNQAKICDKIIQNHVYTECMVNNNKELENAIIKASEQKMASYSSTKKKKIKANLDKKTKSAAKQCMNEQVKFGDSMNGERRHTYCLYENLIELLINVERNIDIYAR